MDNYYWLLPYAKKRGIFFISDIEADLKKNDIYFHKTLIRHAVEYWIIEKCIEVLPLKYYEQFGQLEIKKYVYVRDPA